MTSCLRAQRADLVDCWAVESEAVRRSGESMLHKAMGGCGANLLVGTASGSKYRRALGLVCI